MRKIIKSIIFILILLGLLFGTGEVLRLKWELEDSSYYYRHEIMENNFDDVKFIFLGSSGTNTAINPIYIFEKTGLPSLNLAHSLQSPINTYYLFENYLKKNEGLKLVFLDVVSLTREADPNKKEHEPFFYTSIATFENKKEYFEQFKNDYEKPIGVNYYFPFFRFHSRWNRLSKKDFNSENLVNSILPFQNQDNKEAKFWDIYMKEDNEFNKSKIGEKYLSKIINRAKDEKVEVILTVFPKMNYSLNEINEYKRFANMNQLKLIDFSSKNAINRLKIDLGKDFIDDIHLNYYGGKKISKYIADYIIINYPEFKENISNRTKVFFEKEVKAMKKKYEK